MVGAGEWKDKVRDIGARGMRMFPEIGEFVAAAQADALRALEAAPKGDKKAKEKIVEGFMDKLLERHDEYLLSVGRSPLSPPKPLPSFVEDVTAVPAALVGPAGQIDLGAPLVRPPVARGLPQRYEGQEVVGYDYPATGRGGVKEMFARLNAPLEAKGGGPAKQSTLARRLGRMSVTKNVEKSIQDSIGSVMKTVKPGDAATAAAAEPHLKKLVKALNKVKQAKEARKGELAEAFEGEGKLLRGGDEQDDLLADLQELEEQREDLQATIFDQQQMIQDYYPDQVAGPGPMADALDDMMATLIEIESQIQAVQQRLGEMMAAGPAGDPAAAPAARPASPAEEVKALTRPPTPDPTGSGKGKFASELAKVKMTPTSYLRAVRAKAKKEGYDPKKVSLANDGVHKIKVMNEQGQPRYAGRVGYGDFILWSKVDKKQAQEKKRVFHASHSKIKGDWKKDKYSPNRLALSILW
jgi:hypothetical protein